MRSRGLLRNIEAMDKLWNNVLKPKMLYGKKILIYDKEWLRKFESVAADRLQKATDRLQNTRRK